MAFLRRGLAMVAFMFSLMRLVAVARAQDSIGINYGRVANNLPSAEQVVRLLQSRSVKHVRIYDTDATVLTAFGNSGIDVDVTICNDKVAGLANSNHEKHEVYAFHFKEVSNMKSNKVGWEVALA